jgi:hypothetical protein
MPKTIFGHLFIGEMMAMPLAKTVEECTVAGAPSFRTTPYPKSEVPFNLDSSKH